MNPTLRLSVLLIIAGTIICILVLNILWPIKTEFYDQTDWMWVGGLMIFPLAAAFILAHRPNNRVGWALGVTGVSAGLIFLMTWYAATFEAAPLSREVEAVERLPAVGQFAGIIALLYLFPTGHCVNPWFARILAGFAASASALALIWLLDTSALDITGRPNPLGVLDGGWAFVGDGGFALLLPFALVGVASLVLRWWKSAGSERAQMKWFLMGALFAVSIIIIAGAIPQSDEEGGLLTAGFGILVLFAFWSMPAAVVVAVLRYNLYDIDRVINRTLTYGLLSVGLAAVYAGAVIGLQAILRPVSDGNDLAIVVTTLLVAALFLPARRRVQDAVDRRFNRRSYDAARTIDAFSARLREQIDLDTLRGELLAVVDETMQPANVSMWLRRQRQSE